MTTEEARANLFTRGWVLEDEDSFGARHVKASEEWVFHGDGQNNNTVVSLRSWRGHSANGDPVKTAEFVALAGIRVPGYVVVSEEFATGAAAELAWAITNAEASIEEAVDESARQAWQRHAQVLETLRASLTPPKEGM